MFMGGGGSNILVGTVVGVYLGVYFIFMMEIFLLLYRIWNYVYL
jgi:hypothetical protein